MKRAITLAVLVVALVVAGSATADAAKTVKASAKFSVQLADQSGRYEFGQSKIVKSRLDATPQVPVSLHAGPKARPFQEFVLAGRVEKGRSRRVRRSLSGSTSTWAISRCCSTRPTAAAP